jgi:hypothetical protein
MKYILSLALTLLVFPFLMASQPAPPTPQDERLYELRVYYCEPGRLDALLARFRNHTTKLFEKHGMTNAGYWVPIKNDDNKLVYVLSYPSKEARDASWKGFLADPEWKKVQTASELDGKIVKKIESTLMTATDFSMPLTTSIDTRGRVFELRTYTAAEGKLPDLLTRFRDHTVKLFSKYGMTHIGYWTANANNNTLLYVLAHPSEEAGKKAFDGFRADPAWIQARDASERNGKLTEKVVSEYMVPTDFSTIR